MTNGFGLRRAVIPAIAAALVLALAAAPALAQERWLRIHVQEHDGDAAEVNVNLPLSVLEAIIPTIEQHAFHDGMIDIGDELDGLDLRELLAAVRDAPDADFVTVRSDRESVRVAKEAGVLLVNVDSEDGEKVRVRMPMEVVEAMITDDPQRLDVAAGLRLLAEFGGDLVTVESDDANVRIWIE